MSRAHTSSPSTERHRGGVAGWLRAAVMGANDGIVSTASLLVGIAAAGAGQSELLIAGGAGLAAGALSMAAGEYVSVSSQADIEASDLEREAAELAAHPEFEHKELAGIWRARGLDPELASAVATQLMAEDALRAHARDELGITPHHTARPLQAAVTSALTFAVGAALPLLVASLVDDESRIAAISGSALLFLALLGGLAAQTGGARVTIGVLRVTFWGAVAMGATAGIGALMGVAVG